ncbi:IclR family transcriptional regulator [uncultured Friedmanniella sp.]|uniref:IclR family transcriptional regulator n=1 Tax=uncultured Friedmanniella sp. TaxID=335381 RepID=UPI0035C94C18
MPDAPAAAQALRLLTLLAGQAEPLAASRIAAGLGAARSTTYRLLGVLVDQGFVTYLPDSRTYGLGVAAYELGSAYSRQAPLARIARPLVRRLVDRTGENAHLAVLSGRDVLYVVEERAPGRPVLVTDVGVRLPAPLTASGLALLAALPTRQVRALFPDGGAFVANDLGPATPTALRRLLVDVRRRGHATEDGSVTSGLSSVGHAALDHAGHPVAAVASTFVAADLAGPERLELTRAVVAAADQLTRRLGLPSRSEPSQPTS